MTSWWCERAWLGSEMIASGVVIEVTGDLISAIESDVKQAPPGAQQLFGLTIPALANTHSHAFHRALRGRTHADRGGFWTWRDLMYGTAARLNPDNYFELARATFAEMAEAGIGVVGEFHYVHHQPDGTPYDDANAMGAAVVAAAHEVGIRITLLDTLYLHGGFATSGLERHAPLRPEQLRFSDRTATAWRMRVEDHLARDLAATAKIGCAIHSVRAVDAESIRAASAWTATNDVPLHFHVSEQPDENAACQAAYGCSPVELLAANGALGELSTAVHATHLSEADTSLLATSGSGCCFCPTTERDLADGIGPSRALVESGVALSVGSDSHAVIDILEEARAVELDERLASLERGVHSAAELIVMATSNGYRSLGWDDGGRLRVGRLADFTTVSLDSVRLAGLDSQNTLAAVAFSATATDVASVVVAGEAIVSGGKHVGLDAAGLLTDSIAALVS